MFGRLQLYAIIAVVGFALLTGIYYSWRKGIERQALLEFNQRQLEQTLKDQEEFRRKMKEIQQSQEDLIRKNEEDKKAFESQIENVRGYIDSEEVKKIDRPASPILKETIRKLRSAQ